MLIRTLPIVLLLGTVAAAHAQSSGSIYFECEPAMAPSQYKMAIEQVMAVDPNAAVLYSDDMTIVQIRTAANTSEQAFRDALTQAGITLKPGTRTAEDLGLNAVDPNRPPVYVVTGDAGADDARYRQAVETWNATHPTEQYSTSPIHRQ